MHPSEEKNRLRKSIEERLKRMSDLDRERESRSVCRRLLEKIPEGSVVCSYAPLKTEVDLTLLMEELLKRGDKVYLPRFEGSCRTSPNTKFVFRHIEDLSKLKPGKLFAVPEPPAGTDQADPKEIDIVLVPGRAFDRSGGRVGRGNGGYDYWIERHRKVNPETKMWGVAFECQIVNEVPSEAHDQRLDAVVTVRGVDFNKP